MLTVPSPLTLNRCCETLLFKRDGRRTHSLSAGWRWSHRFLFPPTDGFHRSEGLWFGQKRSQACQCLWTTTRVSGDLKRGQKATCQSKFDKYKKPGLSHPASCWRMARCPHPGGAGVCVHGRGAGWSPAGSTPTLRRRSTLAAAPDSLYVGGRRRTSAAAADQLMITFVSHLSGLVQQKRRSWLSVCADAMDSPQSACSWVGWRGSCSCSRTKPCRGPQPCSGWSDEAGRGPSGGSWTNPIGRLSTKPHTYTSH